MADPMIRAAIPARQPWQPGRTGMPEPGGYGWRGRPRAGWAARAIGAAEAAHGKPVPTCLPCGGLMSYHGGYLRCMACGAGYQSGTEGLPR